MGHWRIRLIRSGPCVTMIITKWCTLLGVFNLEIFSFHFMCNILELVHSMNFILVFAIMVGRIYGVKIWCQKSNFKVGVQNDHNTAISSPYWPIMKLLLAVIVIAHLPIIHMMTFRFCLIMGCPQKILNGQGLKVYTAAQALPLLAAQPDLGRCWQCMGSSVNF